jgi:molybdopterin synthase catalytic subunit
MLAEVSDAACGGVVVYLGTVRSPSRGRKISHLIYEAYEEMAEVEIERIRRVIAEKHGVRLEVQHRLGLVNVGDIAVVIVAAGEHRAEAFAAASELITELKREVPLWKQEVGPDGSRWIEGDKEV